jgi:hypothetical protein
LCGDRILRTPALGSCLRQPGIAACGAESVTLRGVLFHLTEETARHNGHLDILRELADGARGI